MKRIVYCILCLFIAIPLFAQCEPTIEVNSPTTIYGSTSFVFKQESDGGFQAWAEGYYLTIGYADTVCAFAGARDSVTMNTLRAGCYRLLLQQDAYQCTTTVLLRWYDYVLPVELLFFRATAFDDCVLLQWRVANESDGVYYQPFRGDLQLADIQGGRLHYEYPDRTVQPGQHEYFLACVEQSGQRWFMDSTTVLYGEETQLLQPSMECLQAGQIELNLPQSAQVRLTVYNILGQEVAVLADGYFQSGIHQFKFDGSPHPTGIYLVRGRFGNSVIVTKKMPVVK